MKHKIFVWVIIFELYILKKIIEHIEKENTLMVYEIKFPKNFFRIVSHICKLYAIIFVSLRHFMIFDMSMKGV